MISGTKKEELYKNAFLFVSPSRAEAIGIVNLEAARHKTPVITSFNTGLDKGWASNGGMLINPNEDELTKALNKALDWSDEVRNRNGQKLYNFVKKNYSWEERITDLAKLYRHIIKIKS
jgi:glycosyltransferase involved in cell wall biosynthesis